MAIHQFVHIGRHSFIGGGCHVPKDVPPYILAMGAPMRYAGLNLVGLKRKGFTPKELQTLKKVYKILYKSNLTISEAMKRIESEVEICEQVQHVLSFVRNAQRGLIR